MTCEGLGRCLMVTLQTCALKDFRSCWWEADYQACADMRNEEPNWREQICFYYNDRIYCNIFCPARDLFQVGDFYILHLFDTLTTSVQDKIFGSVYGQNFRWRRWGFSLWGLRTLDPPLNPIDTSGNFLRTCQTNQKIWSIFSPFKAILSTFRFVFFKLKNCPQGVGGFP